MKIRKAGQEDSDVIYSIMSSEFSKPPYNESWNKISGMKVVNLYLEQSQVYLAVDEQVIGLVIFKVAPYHDGLVIELQEFVVDSNYQGKGIGSSLLEFVEDFAKKLECSSVQLFVNKSSRAFEFYKKRGYNIDDSYVSMLKKLI